MKLNKIIAAVMALTIIGGSSVVYSRPLNDCSLTASAASEGSFDDMTYMNYGDHIEIIYCDEWAVGELEIPSRIEGLPVTAIDMFAFENCEKITSVKIPDSVTSIGDYAFSGCEGLTSITIPSSVTSIGGEAFLNTPWLENKRKENPLVIVNSLLIDGNVCTGDTVIPDGVKTIGKWAFTECESLTSLTIPDSVTAIEDGAFSYCYGLSTLRIPDSVTSIGDYAFLSSGLTEITIPSTVTDIGSYTFDSCYRLTKITLPSNIKAIGEGMFQACGALTSLTIPNSAKSIGDYAFGDCSGLTSITIPESVTSIGTSAFTGCSSLTSVTILNSGCSIKDSADTISNGYDHSVRSHYYAGTIYGYDNSTAQSYAKKYGYSFEVLGDAADNMLGDVDGNGAIDAVDASMALTAYAKLSTNQDTGITSKQLAAADANSDGAVDAVDASLILSYYAYVSTHGTDSFEDYLKNRK